MILFNDVFKIFGLDGCDLQTGIKPVKNIVDLFDTRHIQTSFVDGDPFRDLIGRQGMCEELLGYGCITLLRQLEIKGLAVAINGAIETDPHAANLHIRLIHSLGNPSDLSDVYVIDRDGSMFAVAPSDTSCDIGPSYSVHFFLAPNDYMPGQVMTEETLAKTPLDPLIGLGHGCAAVAVSDVEMPRHLRCSAHRIRGARSKFRSASGRKDRRTMMHDIVTPVASDAFDSDVLSSSACIAGETLDRGLCPAVRIHPEAVEVERIYSRPPDADPSGGHEHRKQTPWGWRVLVNEHIFTRLEGAVRAAFTDDKLIFSLCLGFLAHVPVRDRMSLHLIVGLLTSRLALPMARQ